MATCEWVIDIIQEWADARFLQPPCFIDRGDPAVPDFVLGDLTFDAAWRDLDFSGVVPSNASGVCLAIKFNSILIASILTLRTKGNVNTDSVSEVVSHVAGVDNPYDKTLPIGSDGIIEYRGSGPGIAVADITVKGWWL